MDDLYLARDTRSDADVALRVLSIFVDEAETIERLRERAERIAALGHDGLAGLTAIEKIEGAVLAAAEGIEGKALDHFIPPQGLLPRDVFDLSLDLAAALDALHTDGHLHGYLHPGRVVVDEEREARLLVIGPEEAERQPPLRAAAFRAPELVAGEPLDAQAEVFALGGLLHLVATGDPPFSGETAEEIGESACNELPIPIDELRPELPHELAVLVARCLKKDRDLRYATAHEVLTDLAALKDAIIEGKVGGGARKAADGVVPEATGRRPPIESKPDSPTARAGLWGAIAEFGSRLGGIPGWRPVAAGLAVLGAFALGYYISGGAPAAGGGSTATLAPATSSDDPELFPRLSPDGRRLFFARPQAGDWHIYSQPTDGGEAEALTAASGFGATQPALSADGRRLAFRSQRDGGGIFVMDADGGNLRQVSASGYNPSWSPDGSALAVADVPVAATPPLQQRSTVRVIDVVTGAERRLPGAEGLQPAWSPNGDRIAYWAPDGMGGADLFTIAADGGDPLPVTRDRAVDWSPAWSPAGDYLYFVSDRSGGMNLWRVPISEGSGTVRGAPEPVTSSGSVRSIHPSFARQAGTLVYVEAITRRRLYRIPFNASTGAVSGRPEVLPGVPRDASSPDLAGDGSRIAFVRGEGDTESVHVAALDGSGSVRIGGADGSARSPRLSPDGRRVAFLADHQGSLQLWTAAAQGGALRQHTELKTDKVSRPVWSHDGSGIGLTVGGQFVPSYTLLFDAGRSAADNVADTLYSSPADGSFEPHSWSPDGARVAGALRDRDGQLNGIAVLSLQSGEVEQLTGFGMHPVWLRDGRRLLFQWGSGLYLVDSRSPEPRRVYTSLPDALGEVFSLSPDDRWIYVSLDRTEADAWLRRPTR